MITVFTAPECPWCHKVKAYLAQKEVKFVEINVAADLAGRNQLIDLTHQLHVPVLKINDAVITGFDRAQIDAQLAALS